VPVKSNTHVNKSRGCSGNPVTVICTIN